MEEPAAVGGWRFEVGGGKANIKKSEIRGLISAGQSLECRKNGFCLMPKAKRSSNLTPLKAMVRDRMAERLSFGGLSMALQFIPKQLFNFRIGTAEAYPCMKLFG
jgi:hypothetical protein